MGDIRQKKIRVDRANPLVRIPAILFKDIDKRKRKIPLKIKYSHLTFVVLIDYEKLEAKPDKVSL